MAVTTREQVMDALMALLTAAMVGSGNPCKTSSRHFRLWGNTPKPERPALYLKQLKPQLYEANRDGVPPRRTMRVSCFVYTNCAQDDPTPDKQLNDILDAFDAALAPSPLTQTQTLGNLVVNAKINGEVFMDTGDLDGDGLLVVPIDILLP